jgi:choline kinase
MINQKSDKVISVVIPAAGKGTRFDINGNSHKMLLPNKDGIPILMDSINTIVSNILKKELFPQIVIIVNEHTAANVMGTLKDGGFNEVPNGCIEYVYQNIEEKPGFWYAFILGLKICRGNKVILIPADNVIKKETKFFDDALNSSNQIIMGVTDQYEDSLENYFWMYEGKDGMHYMDHLKQPSNVDKSSVLIHMGPIIFDMKTAVMAYSLARTLLVSDSKSFIKTYDFFDIGTPIRYAMSLLQEPTRKQK